MNDVEEVKATNIAEERNEVCEEATEERRLFVKDVIETIGNDINGGTDVNLVRSLIEHNGEYCLFEDVLERDRLNEDIDLHDVRINQVMDHMMQIDSERYNKVVDKRYIRQIKDSTMQIKMHMDGGANRSVTDDIRLLNEVRNIKPYVMSGAQKDDASIICTKVGFITLLCQGHGSIKVRTFYSPDIAETIISPGDITSSNSNNYTVWDQRCDHKNNIGFIRFSSESGIQSATVNTYLRNGIWYAQQSLLDCICPTYNDVFETPDLDTPIIRKLNAAATHELWHQRLCHPGKSMMENIHKTADGIPNLMHGRNSFYKCQTCMRAKVQSASKNKNAEPTFQVERPGQQFHMDFGFVRGSDFKTKNDDGRIITSRDGYNCYLIIVDKFSGYMWVMLSNNKEPPLEFVKTFLEKHGDRNSPIRQVRTDQGGELWSSTDYKEVVTKAGFILEPTGAGNPKQNGQAEAPNKTLGRLMRGMLYNAGLGSEYWSYALTHAVYVKNRLPHTKFHLKMSPYESLTGIRPNLSNLKVWGCRVVVKQPIIKGAKLDDISSQGIFLRYTATPKNVVYLDLETNREKISTDVVFDEANFVSGNKNPGGKALVEAGQQKQNPKASDSNQAIIKVKQLHEHAILPSRATPQSAGLDIHTIHDIVIDAGMTKFINTGISVSVPEGTYGRLAPRSGNSLKKDIDVKAGVVDADYRGEVGVVLFNRGQKQQKFVRGDKIAQMIIEKCVMHTPMDWELELESTDRGGNGFGSSDKICTIKGDDKFENITMSSNPFEDVLTIECRIKGNDSLLGLDLDDRSHADRLILIQCKKGTASARIPRWRSQLRGAVLTKIEGLRVKTKVDAIKVIEESKKQSKKLIQLTFATVAKVHIHPQKGIPQLFHDQLNILSTHQQELRRKENVIAKHCHLDEWDAIVRKLNNENYSEHKVEDKIVPNKLTRKWLTQQSDWKDWQKSEYKQLDQYELQNMFGQPEPRPTKANILTLLWTYLIKATGVKKARCCCNGNPGRQGSITLAHTYAACVEQPAQRVYWGIVAIEGLIAVGADASNAFAEAPPPKAPLYVLIDKPYRDWYRSKGRGEIPKGYVLRVKHAIQGHPEAPRLWSMFIDDIIRNKIGLTATTHEQCLYHGTFNGEKIYFLRQVDDFSVASVSKTTCDKLIEEISKHLTAPLKNLGVVDRFNGVQIEQTNQFVKIHNKEYVEKILGKHGWLNDQYKTKNRPIPMRSESAYLREMEVSKGPVEEKEKKKLETKMKFNFRQALGEVLYAMVTCRPDISMAVTKLSQYANNPSEIHYNALKNIFRYLRMTKDDGLYFWRTKRTNFEELKMGTMPKVYSDEKEIMSVVNHKSKYKRKIDEDLVGFTDSDWAGDVEHRRSITGMAVFFGGSVVAYKSKFQSTIALSSTEAEFSAACDTGKVILYLRSILDEMGISQKHATVLYEDNQGAIMMANARQPTRRTRHVETAQFAIIDWIEKDLLYLEFVESSLNCADAMNKPLSRILFYKHFDRIMGRLIPKQFATDSARSKEKSHTTDHTETESCKSLTIEVSN